MPIYSLIAGILIALNTVIFGYQENIPSLLGLIVLAIMWAAVLKKEG